MLPLWIIDITGSTRRDYFQNLVGKIDHVYIPHSVKNKITSAEEQPCETEESVLSKISVANNSEQKSGSVDEEKMAEQKAFKEELEDRARFEAEKNAIIEGDYWFYSPMESTFFQDLPEEYQKKLDIILEERNAKNEEEGSNSLTKEDIATYTYAMKLYRFQEEMVKEGVRFIDQLRHSNCPPYQTINVVVLGDSTEEFTLNVFASIAAILLKEKGRFLPTHVHQGISIFGCLYVPCDINTYLVEKRNRILHLLDEIEVQHNLSSIRGYDHMMLYQNVQNRTDCHYPIMDEKAQAEYLLQCLAHLFLACDIHHPLISGTSSDDTFYFSMGAASVHFDMEIEDAKDANDVANNLIKKFKEEVCLEQAEKTEPLINPEVYSAEQYVKLFTKNIDPIEIDSKIGFPHPILNYLNKNLKRAYYQLSLRYFPADLLRKILQQIEQNTSDVLDLISARSQKAFNDAELSLYPAISQRISKLSSKKGGLSHIEDLLKNVQELMSKERETISHKLEAVFWNRLLMQEDTTIPKNQKDYFEEYHNIYRSDISAKNDGAGCTSTREEALKRFKDLLSKEQTTLATLVRAFFLGIICVLFFLPIFDFLSPDLLNLGDVKKNAFYWGCLVFMIPLIIQYIKYLSYLRKRGACIRKLKAYYTHDAYARLANRIEFEANEFYQKITDLAEEYLKRCKKIRNEIKMPKFDQETKMLLPVTQFNQPLNGGLFHNEEIIPAKEIESSKIRINYNPVSVNDITTEQFFILINYYSGIFSKLFQDVSLTEAYVKTFNEDTGEYYFKSKNEILAGKEKNWKDAKKNFYREITQGIKDELLPREFPTAGDKLMQYKKKIERYTLLEPLMTFAATNGEITSHADTEYADIKINRVLDDDLSAPYLPLVTTRVQVAPFEKIFEKYIFITRWRCFDHFSYNRILPKEDFDIKARQEVNYKDYIKAQKAKKKEQERRDNGMAKEASTQSIEEEKTDYVQCPSSLIMWAVCPNDNSGVWLKIFSPEHFSRAYEDREKYREVLNQND